MSQLFSQETLNNWGSNKVLPLWKLLCNTLIWFTPSSQVCHKMMRMQEIYCSSSSIDVLLAPGATAYNGTGGEHSVLFLTTPAFQIIMACVDYFFFPSLLPSPTS